MLVFMVLRKNENKTGITSLERGGSLSNGRLIE